MHQSDIRFLDLPNEILIIILKKLGNIDVLYSLFGIKNERIDTLLEDNVFSSILNFVISSITNDKLDRFSTYILRQRHHYIKKLIIDTTYMEPILLAGDYPNLNSLELFNFGQEIVFRYFTDDSIFRHIFKYKIIDLILHNDDRFPDEMLLNIYTVNVYARIMVLFQNLKHLTIVPSPVNNYPPLTLCVLGPTVQFFSALSALSIKVFQFYDCLALLDGRLKQLNTFIVQVVYISPSFNWKIHYPSITTHMAELHSLKCFSLTSYRVTSHYRQLVVPLFRRMTNLEKLALYLRIGQRSPERNLGSPFIDGTHLHKEILIHMRQVRTFTFYISTENSAYNLSRSVSTDDIQQTFTSIKYGQTACIIEDIDRFTTTCHVYSLPYLFTRLIKISSKFPNIIFNTVTHLSVNDSIPLNHEFFMRISRAFPILNCFSLENTIRQLCNDNLMKSAENLSDPIIEYRHLISLDLRNANSDYIVQFLLETKTHLPRLTQLKVKYDELATATLHFTRDTMRRNCSKVKQLIIGNIHFSKDIYQYFPSL